MSVLSRPHFHDEEAAFAFLEEALWPQGPVCTHCGTMDRISKIKANPEKRVRYGLHKCGHCKKQFRVTVGTVFEHARLPLHKMLQAVHLMCASKRGISAHELHRILEVQYKTAWLLAHRIRLAMEQTGGLPPIGGLGAIVEVDETYIGKHSVLSTDEGQWYSAIGTEFLNHVTVNHGQKEWKRGYAHTQTVEGFFSVFKRGMKGIYQHCSEKHLHRYLAEFDFRYSNRVRLGVGDTMRAGRALEGIKGKRLRYQSTHQ